MRGKDGRKGEWAGRVSGARRETEGEKNRERRGGEIHPISNEDA